MVKILFYAWSLTLFLTEVPSVSAGSGAVAAEGVRPPARRTVFGWFPRDMNNWDTAAIDWSVLTHLPIRCVVHQPDGTVTLGGGCTPERIRKTVAQAHAQPARALPAPPPPHPRRVVAQLLNILLVEELRAIQAPIKIRHLRTSPPTSAPANARFTGKMNSPGVAYQTPVPIGS